MFKDGNYIRLLYEDYIALSSEFEFNINSNNEIIEIINLKNNEKIVGNISYFLNKCCKILKVNNGDIEIAVYNLDLKQLESDKTLNIKDWLIDRKIEFGFMTFEEAMKDVFKPREPMNKEEIKALASALSEISGNNGSY